MAYKATVKVHGKCPKHPRYNPEKQGQGAIKAGCVTCAQLHLLFHSVHTLRNLQKSVDAAIAETTK